MLRLVPVMVWCRHATSHFLNQMLTKIRDTGYWRINSSLSKAAYMHRWIGSSLVQILACRLFGTKPLSEPMLAYCKLHPWEQVSAKFHSKFKHFHSRKCLLRNGSHVDCSVSIWLDSFPKHLAFHGTHKSIISFLSQNYQHCFLQSFYLHWKFSHR